MTGSEAGRRIVRAVCGIVFIAATGLTLAHAQEPYAVAHPECEYFGAKRESFIAAKMREHRLTALTEQVTAQLPQAASGGKAAHPTTRYQAGVERANLIDHYIFPAIANAGIAPAERTNDYEFVRRVYLDLAGRIPTAAEVVQFVEIDGRENKRAELIDRLLASPDWVDKWTLFFGDLFKNTSNKASSGTLTYPEGRNAFYTWIHTSLANNKPYNEMAREIIAAQSANTWDPQQATANWIVLGRATMGPLQDTQDQVTANIAETFLGLANLNCLLCHNGRGHLDAVNLWGAQTTRYQAWQMAAFMAHMPNATLVRSDPSVNNSPYYWTIHDTLTSDYQLGSTSGNRPPRTPIGNQKTVAPAYLFNGYSPQKGEDYRSAFARQVTGDFQFARAAVNYVWQQFFGRGIVEPANQFDPARLDPANPPPDPWTLQPSNPALLNALAQHFIDSGYDIRALMRLIANSETYQLESRYTGAWNATNESLFARKLVRRLWAEELHDAIAQSSGVPPAYKVFMGEDPNDIAGGTVTLSRALLFPETNSVNMGGISVNGFLDAFLRGNRDDYPRNGEGSLSQALDLMNDSFVMSRVHSSSSGANSLINKSLAMTDAQLIDNLYMNVLSRHPSADEKAAALNALSTGNRTQKAENLLWSLYNKVDFIFNY